MPCQMMSIKNILLESLRVYFYEIMAVACSFLEEKAIVILLSAQYHQNGEQSFIQNVDDNGPI